MWFSRTRRNEPAPPLELEPVATVDAQAVVGDLARHASAIGRDAAELRGVMDDGTRVAADQVASLQALSATLAQVVQGQSDIDGEAGHSLQAARGAREAVQALGAEVAAIVDTLHQVAEAAGQITQIALQTRLVAFNASVEAKRAGDAGRGFGVVADAVKDLATRVESSSKHIMGTVGTLESRIGVLASETRVDPRDGAEQGAVHSALQKVEQAAARIAERAAASHGRCVELEGGMGEVGQAMQRTAQALQAALGRTDTFLGASEQMIESVARCGVRTEDTPYIEGVKTAAAQISKLLEDALRTGTIGQDDLFDERYQPQPGTSPQQHLARFTALAERLFPQVQERMLSLSDKVVFCIAVDRNGYVPCHNKAYNQPQRPGDTVWNTAHSRNRRIFNDRTGLASARNAKPFLLQTYRRDMGGGQFVVMKEAAAPITVAGRHWGGVRLAFRF